MIVVSILVFITILGLLVIVHELGHFVAARFFKVGVDEFGVGFPPRITGIKKGKTLYSLNWIPVGGFVKIKGVIGGDQMDTPVPAGDEKNKKSSDDFSSHPMWQRFIILFAGIFMNIVLAVFLFSVGFMIGMPSSISDLPSNATVTNPEVLVVEVQENGPASHQGIKIGDAITKVNDIEINHSTDFTNSLLGLESGTSVDIEISRGNDEIFQYSVTPEILEETDTLGVGVFLAETGIVRLPWYSAIWHGVIQTYEMIRMILYAIINLVVGLFDGEASNVAIAGPLGIASLTHEATQLGIVYIIQFAALLSINLAIFNLFPFPALDGGRILFLLFEFVLRKPINPKIEAVVHNLGFILLLTLLMVVTLKDLLDLF
ncbi:MAG: RIP metalloprotease RseP [bacterium]|nr:RIP metalloprotease RseP [bacterium]